MASRTSRASRKGFGFLLASLFLGLMLSGLFNTFMIAGAQSGDSAISPAPAQATALPPQPAAPLQVQVVSSPALAGDPGEAPEAASIWTDELIRQAKPYPMPTPPAGLDLLPAAPGGPAGWAPASPPDGPGQGFVAGFSAPAAVQQDLTYINPDSYTIFPFRAVGKVYFIMGGQAYGCSASVIAEYAIWTAGHCVHAGNGDPNAWHTNWIFIPAYKDGVRPYGTWQADYLYTTNQWINGADLRYDFGVAIVKPMNGLTVRQTVGALGFAWNQPLDQARIAMGYPSKPQPPYDGLKQVISIASSAFYDLNQSTPPIPVGIVSQMQSGASGGPWMLNYAKTSDPSFNLLNGQNSYIYTSQQAIYSPYFGEAAKTVYDCASQSTPTYKSCGNDADLALTQSARSWVLPGKAFTYTLAIQNQGALTGTHLVLTDTIGVGTTLITASLPGGSCGSHGRNIFCTLAVFPRWTTITATVAVTSPLKSGVTLNLAGARSDQNDPTPQNNVGVSLSVPVGTPIFLPLIRR